MWCLVFETGYTNQQLNNVKEYFMVNTYFWRSHIMLIKLTYIQIKKQQWEMNMYVKFKFVQIKMKHLFY